MLIKCPECGLQASDKAISCPHCGYPIQSIEKVKPARKSNRRKRLPNGFGQITEIKGRNLRNPFRAMITVGKDENGRPISELLKPNAYFPTYNDAYIALMEYNKNPYDLDSFITIKELYERWSTEYFKTLTADSSARNVTAAWAYCSELYDMKVRDLRVRHIKGCIDNGKRMWKGEERFPSDNTKGRIKSLFNLMLDYAVEYEIVERNYAKAFALPDEIANVRKRAKKAHIAFTDEETNILWDNLNIIPYVDIVLIQCYSGWRPQELGLLRVENVNLEEGYIIGGMKSDAGTNRIVPIHSKIYDLVVDKYNEALSLGSKFLINYTDENAYTNDLKLTYKRYNYRFGLLMGKLNLNANHRPHDPRTHFVTTAKRYGVDEYAIKHIIGHTITDLTERVYTKRNVEWLKEEMEKIR